MPSCTYFVQECPTCGRHLQIRVEYLGRRVVCQHCHGTLVAADPALVRLDQAASESTILRRAEELLSGIATSKGRPTPHSEVTG